MTTLTTAGKTPSVSNLSAVLATIADEVAPSTRKAYEQAMSSLSSHFEKSGWQLYPQAEGALDEARFLEQVLSYLQTLTDDGKTYSTINKTLSALKNVAGYENPRAYSTLLLKPVKAYMEGLARQSKAHDPRRAQALTLEQLEQLYKGLKGRSPRDLRDKALVALGIATALRSQNLGELTLSDISPATTIDGIVVKVRFSKTDQKGKGHYIPVARASRKKLDPVHALNEWLNVLKLYGFDKESTPDFPLFPNIRGQRGVQSAPMLNPSITITETLRSRLVAAEVVSEAQVQQFSSHSLRSTFITLLLQRGIDATKVMKVSNHKSAENLLRYDRSSVEIYAQADYLKPRG